MRLSFSRLPAMMVGQPRSKPTSDAGSSLRPPLGPSASSASSSPPACRTCASGLCVWGPLLAAASLGQAWPALEEHAKEPHQGCCAAGSHLGRPHVHARGLGLAGCCLHERKVAAPWCPSRGPGRRAAQRRVPGLGKAMASLPPISTTRGCYTLAMGIASRMGARGLRPRCSRLPVQSAGPCAPWCPSRGPG